MVEGNLKNDLQVFLVSIDYSAEPLCEYLKITKVFNVIKNGLVNL